MTESKPEANPVRTRSAGTLFLDEDASVHVDHVFLAEGKAGTCDHDGCNEPAHDPGGVGITVCEDDDTDVTVVMSPLQALWLANRLTRAANFALESGEEPPDLERDIARITGPGK